LSADPVTLLKMMRSLNPAARQITSPGFTPCVIPSKVKMPAPAGIVKVQPHCPNILGAENSKRTKTRKSLFNVTTGLGRRFNGVMVQVDNVIMSFIARQKVIAFYPGNTSGFTNLRENHPETESIVKLKKFKMKFLSNPTVPS
jgi:hypothetical protein